MGLDTTHDCWHGPYSAFSRWRNQVAIAGGYFTSVQGRNGFESPNVDWEDFEERNYFGDWDQYPDDVLLVLIVHSDCDGLIKPDIAGYLADRLEELLPRVTGDEPYGGWHEITQGFIDGLRSAVAANESVQFH